MWPPARCPPRRSSPATPTATYRARAHNLDIITPPWRSRTCWPAGTGCRPKRSTRSGARIRSGPSSARRPRAGSPYTDPQNPNESRIHWMIRRSEHVRKQQKPALSGRNGWQSGPDSAVSRLTPWWWPASRTANRVEAGEFRGAHGVQWLCRGPASCERLQTQVDPKPL